MKPSADGENLGVRNGRKSVKSVTVQDIYIYFGSENTTANMSACELNILSAMVRYLLIDLN